MQGLHLYAVENEGPSTKWIVATNFHLTALDEFPAGNRKPERAFSLFRGGRYQLNYVTHCNISFLNSSRFLQREVNLRRSVVLKSFAPGSELADSRMTEIAVTVRVANINTLCVCKAKRVRPERIGAFHSLQPFTRSALLPHDAIKVRTRDDVLIFGPVRNINPLRALSCYDAMRYANQIRLLGQLQIASVCCIGVFDR
jgi:hypothetical protein